jgi:hypothetical protein
MTTKPTKAQSAKRRDWLETVLRTRPGDTHPDLGKYTEQAVPRGLERCCVPEVRPAARVGRQR